MASSPQIDPAGLYQEHTPPLPGDGDETPPLNPAEEHSQVPAPLDRTRHWHSSLVVFCLASAALIFLFWGEITAALRVWSTSRTFGHAFLIFPISLLLLFRLRHRLVAVEPRTSPMALVPATAFAMLWALGELANVMVAKQIAFLGIWQSFFLLVFGWPAMRVALFPLAYLYLAIPMGASIIPALQDVTAQMVVQLLRLTGIPVYLDGYFIQIPSGSFLVAEACSGVRYLIVSGALGLLVAHLFFNSWHRRCFFVVLSLLVPIFANGIRAYGIIMLAHLSDYRIAVDIDHIVYGALFLGVVTAILLGIATLLRQRHDPLLTLPAGPGTAAAGSLRQRTMLAGLPGQAGFGLSALLLVLALQVWIAEAKRIPETPVATLRAPTVQLPWSAVDEGAPPWRPTLVGTDASLHQRYRDGSQLIDLHIGYYGYQREGAEAINDQNRIVGEGRKWQALTLRSVSPRLPGGIDQVNEMTIQGEKDSYLVWYWYEIGGLAMTSRMRAKLAEVIATTIGDDRSAAVVAIGVRFTEDGSRARETLRQFLTDGIQDRAVLVELAEGTGILGTADMKSSPPATQ